MAWFRKSDSTPADHGPVACSFCGAAREQVNQLLAGDHAAICDGCVHASVDTLRSHMTGAKKAPDGPLDLQALRRAIDSRVIGHTGVKTALLSALQLHHDRALASGCWRSPRLLIVGPPGSGKSTLVHAALGAMSFPSEIAHLTRLSETGYVGDDVENLVGGLLRAASGDITLAEAGVLGLEGLEHLVEDSAEARRRKTRLVSGHAVQRELLRLLDGGALEALSPGAQRHPQAPSRPLECRGLLVIFTATLPEPPTDEHNLRSALLERGIMPDLLSRIDRIVVAKRRSVEEMRAVLMHERGPLEMARASAAAMGAELVVEAEAANVIASSAANDPAGAWVLRRPLLRFMERIFNDRQPARKWTLDAVTAEQLLS